MRIEVGKLYVTQSGEKVRIYAVDGGSFKNGVHGAIKVDDDFWMVCSWDNNGNCTSENMPEWKIVGEFEGGKRAVAWISLDLYGNPNAGSAFFLPEGKHPGEYSYLGNFKRAPWLDEPEQT